jgi:hypothetical protein
MFRTEHAAFPAKIDWRNLPEEIVLTIIKHVPNAVDAINLAMTCRSYNRIIAHESSYWAQHGASRPPLAVDVGLATWVTKVKTLPKSMKTVMPHLDEPVDVFSDAGYLKLGTASGGAMRADLFMRFARQMGSNVVLMNKYFKDASDSATACGLRRPRLDNKMKLIYAFDIQKHGGNVQLGASDDEIVTTWRTLVQTEQCRTHNGCANVSVSPPIVAAPTNSNLKSQLNKHRAESRWIVKPKFLYKKGLKKHTANAFAAAASWDACLLHAEMQNASRCAAKANIERPPLVLRMKLIFFLDILERGGQVEVNASDDAILASWCRLGRISQDDARPLNHGWRERLLRRVGVEQSSVDLKKQVPNGASNLSPCAGKPRTSGSAVKRILGDFI